MRIWIDTDIGSDVDDALAVAYALRHPDLELVGVSTVFGDVALRSRIADALLQIAGVVDVPVVTGLGVPLTPRRAGIMFGHEGRGIVDNPDPVLRVETEPDGDLRVEAISDALRSAKPDVVLAIGPLTNIAALTLAGAPLPRLAIMGGKLDDVMLPGMIPEIPEWNWFCDPDAVRQVVTAERRERPIVVPAEVTFRTRLDAGDVELLAGGDAVTRALSTLCDHWIQAQRDLFDSDRPGVALHDPLTAAVLVEDGLCTFESRAISVDDHGASHPVRSSANIEAAVDVDPGAVRDHLMTTWLV